MKKVGYIMIEITKKQWNEIPNDYKGAWEAWIIEGGWQPDLPKEYIGKKTVMSGCISNEIGSLLTEGAHFIIV